MRRTVWIAGALALGMALVSPVLSAQQDEATVVKAMKLSGPAFGAVRKATEAMSADTVKENAAVLGQSFGQTEAFFKSRGKQDAVKWAQDAAKVSQTLAAQAGKADWEGAKKSATELGTFCASCHTAYRDKGPDGAYRVKPGN